MTGSTLVRLPFYYGWVIVATGALCIVACLGFGRFALGMLLPSMAAALAGAAIALSALLAAPRH